MISGLVQGGAGLNQRFARFRMLRSEDLFMELQSFIEMRSGCGMVAGMMIRQGQFLAPFRQTLPIGLRAARTLMIDAAPGRVL